MLAPGLAMCVALHAVGVRPKNPAGIPMDTRRGQCFTGTQGQLLELRIAISSIVPCLGVEGTIDIGLEMR